MGTLFSQVPWTCQCCWSSQRLWSSQLRQDKEAVVVPCISLVVWQRGSYQHWIFLICIHTKILCIYDLPVSVVWQEQLVRTLCQQHLSGRFHDSCFNHCDHIYSWIMWHSWHHACLEVLHLLFSKAKEVHVDGKVGLVSLVWSLLKGWHHSQVLCH